MGTLPGSRRLNGDSWVALGLIAANAMFLRDLLAGEPDGAYVKTTTLPIVLSLAMIVLALLLLGWSMRRPSGQAAGISKDTEENGGLSPLMRVVVVIALTIVYITALPWFGYLLSSSLYFGGLSLMYGNRRPVPILVVMIAVPLAL
ncbi:MAG: tripartite tricarboxylate transporter TctB family protein, partial [Halocynthiibacter sp.]